MKIIISLILSIFFLAALAAVIIEQKTPSNKYTYTTAICEKNICYDVLINCDGAQIKNIKPLTGKITFSEEWRDTREKIELCQNP
mgnify:CR=1 FL=1